LIRTGRGDLQKMLNMTGGGGVKNALYPDKKNRRKRDIEEKSDCR